MREKAIRAVIRILRWPVQILLAVFFGFVGYMKTFAPMPDLEIYHAWVADLHPAIARGVGVSEIICAVGLVLPGMIAGGQRLVGLFAVLLIGNQAIAILFHGIRGDLGPALTQNLLLIGLLAFLRLTSDPQPDFRQRLLER